MPSSASVKASASGSWETGVAAAGIDGSVGRRIPGGGGGGASGGPRYRSGCRSNACAQPGAQKKNSRPSYSRRALAVAGSTVIPQTGSIVSVPLAPLPGRLVSGLPFERLRSAHRHKLPVALASSESLSA